MINKRYNSYLNFFEIQKKNSKEIFKISNLLKNKEKFLDLKPKYNTIFIFGLPRSGTTFLYDRICNQFEVGYVDNIFARFWKSPLFGAKISNNLLELQNNKDHNNFYGRTFKLKSPHEFSYFWMYWLKIKKHYTKFNSKNNVDWKKLTTIIKNIQHEFKKPIVFKTGFAANFSSYFEKYFPYPFFIYIKRSPKQVAVSILKARIANNQSRKKWWSMSPSNYAKFKKKNYLDQIANQVNQLNEDYQKAYDKIDNDKKILIDFSEYVKDPIKIERKIFNKLKKKYPKTKFNKKKIAFRNPNIKLSKSEIKKLISKINIT